MKILKMAAVVVVLALAGLVIAAPIGPLPGFFIGGNQAEVPQQWPDTSGVHEIKLRVPGTLPRVVIIWVIDYAGELHVVGSADSGWVSMIGEGSPVQMRLGSETYALNAVRVTADLGPIVTAYSDKYRPDYPDIVAGFPSSAEAAGQFRVYRLNRS